MQFSHVRGISRGSNVNKMQLKAQIEEEERREAWEHSLEDKRGSDFIRPDTFSIGLMLLLIVLFSVVAVAA